jgi:hypothetical protein
MISKVVIEQGLINVYDEGDQLISSIDALNSEIGAVAPLFYVICNNSDNVIQVYNELGKQLSSMEKTGKVVMGTIENSIIIKNNLFIESYDIQFNKLFIYNSVAALKALKTQALKHLRIGLGQYLKEIESLKRLSVSLHHYELSAELLPVTTIIEKLLELSEK